MKVFILDYSVGNLRSIEKAFKKFGVECIVSNKYKEFKDSDAIILPGVGSFDSAIKSIPKEIVDEILDKYILGICLGMQILFERSEEGKMKGLGLIKGEVKRLKNVDIIPHMGWNRIYIRKNSEIVRGINDGDFFYFVHSYYCSPKEDVTIATCIYGVEFPAIIEKNNIFGTQFHPEKSSKKGLKLIENFIKIVKC